MKRLPLSIILFLWACAAPAQGLSYLEQFECTREPWGMPVPDTYAELRRLDMLKRETVNPGYTPGRDSRVFEFDGLTVWAGHAGADDEHVMVERIEITSQRWQWSSWANVGDELDSVLRRAGWPAVTRGPKIEFGSDADSVALHVRNGRVVRVVYTCNAPQD